MEEWRDIEGYEGLYQISNWGRVKSLNYKRTGEEGILLPSPNKHGYLRIDLCKKGEKPKHFSIHRLVAQAFIPNPDNLPQVNHKDENKTNNYVYNLEWCDDKYNVNYGTRNERGAEKRKGKKHTEESKNKISESHYKKIKCVTTNEIFNSIIEASENYNINKSNITQCCRGKRKSAGKHPITGEKLVWEYV